MIPPIPERDKAAAMALGLAELDAVRSWNRYASWTIEHHGEHVLLGGKHWLRWAQEDLLTLAKNRDGQEDEKARKAREREAYGRASLTFEQWIAVLRQRNDRGEPLTPHEEQLLGWYDRQRNPPRGIAAMFAFIDYARGARRPVDPFPPDELEQLRQEQLAEAREIEP